MSTITTNLNLNKTVHYDPKKDKDKDDELLQLRKKQNKGSVPSNNITFEIVKSIRDKLQRN